MPGKEVGRLLANPVAVSPIPDAPTPAATKRAATSGPVVVFAGGGTGGHIYPSLAVVEALQRQGVNIEPHFVVSHRAVDADIMANTGLASTASPARPLSSHPARLPGFVNAWRRGVQQAKRLYQQHQVAAVISTGGFVSGPAVVAAKKRGLPIALVNLDAVPGKANRFLLRAVQEVFTVHPHGTMPHATRIGLPLREHAKSPCRDGCVDKPAARVALGLQPDRPTLLVTGGSQGAGSLNDAVLALLDNKEARAAMAGWQVLHICGAKHAAAMEHAYAQQAVDQQSVAREGNGVRRSDGPTVLVRGYCDRMGHAWGAADVAISRAGAGSVAEVWANAVPTIFMPYPRHRDDHQRLNAQPLVAAGAALLIKDQQRVDLNLADLLPGLMGLIADEPRRRSMSDALASTCPEDGASVLAAWVAEKVHAKPSPKADGVAA